MEGYLRSLRCVVRRRLFSGQQTATSLLSPVQRLGLRGLRVRENENSDPPSPTLAVHEHDQRWQQSQQPEIPRLVFPGAGIFFYWQAGVVTYLREAGYDLSRVDLSGASAGAITATLAATNVDYYHATDVALRLGQEAGVWTRPLGLMGVWGGLIEDWLDIVLPQDAAECCNERLSVLLTPFPSIFEKQRVTQFVDKNDVIRCNIASVHLPLFLDGRIASSYRDRLHIDGSFLSSPSDHFPDAVSDSKGGPKSCVVLDFQHDPLLQGKKKAFIKLASKDGIMSLLERGREYAAIMDRGGYFDKLPRTDVLHLV